MAEVEEEGRVGGFSGGSDGTEKFQGNWQSVWGQAVGRWDEKQRQPNSVNRVGIENISQTLKSNQFCLCKIEYVIFKPKLK